MPSVLKRKELAVGLDEAFDLKEGTDLPEPVAKQIEGFISECDKLGGSSAGNVDAKFGRKRLTLICEAKKAELVG